MPGRHNKGLASETPGAAPPSAHRPVQQNMVDATELWKMLTGPKACPMRLTSRDVQILVRGLTTTFNWCRIAVIHSSHGSSKNHWKLCRLVSECCRMRCATQTEQYHKHPQKTQDGDGDTISSWQNCQIKCASVAFTESILVPNNNILQRMQTIFWMFLSPSTVHTFIHGKIQQFYPPGLGIHCHRPWHLSAARFVGGTNFFVWVKGAAEVQETDARMMS